MAASQSDGLIADGWVSFAGVDDSEVHFHWIDIGPVEVGVSSEGYPEQ
jgi:hypothetical protein